VGPFYSTIKLDLEQQREIETIVSAGSFRVLTQGELPSFIPNALRTRCEGAYIAASAGPNCTTYIMCDLHRVDAKASCIDQEPLLGIVTSGGAQSVATFAHHGDWPGRSCNPPQAHWNSIKASGIGAYYNSAIPPSLKQGFLSDLPQGEKSAFEAIINGIAKSNMEESTG